MNQENELAVHYLSESIKDLSKIKALVENAITQLNDADLHYLPDSESNNIVIIMKHLGGNMVSRWTDFLTTDGEKPDRNRDNEFVDDLKSREELMQLWERGWKCLFDTLNSLTPDDLMKTIYVKGVANTVVEAINRQLWHYAYHAGQVVYLAKHIKKSEWKTLSIPKKINATK